MNTVDKVLNVAREQIGYLEKRTPYDEDSKTGNAGYNNYTKYGRDLVKWIGGPYADGVYWCDEFVDWCFVVAYGMEEAKKLLGGWSAYCPTSVQFFKNLGEWHASNPKKGDVIYFLDSKNEAGHTGIVESVDSTTVYTIEGNTSSSEGVVPNGGGVFRKSYSLNYRKILGYGRPKYATKPKGKYTKKLPVLTAKRPVLKKGQKNLQVQRTQKFLNWYFDDCVVDGRPLETDKIFGENTRKGVFKFQQDMFPNDVSEHDGIVGPATVAKMKTFK
jgi:hypothetical protein